MIPQAQGCGSIEAVPDACLDVTTDRRYNFLSVRNEWDEAKRLANLRKHGIDFANTAEIFEGRTLTTEDTRCDYGERRFITIGLLRGRTVTVVHTEDDESLRIISIRKATSYEEKTYFEKRRD